MPLWEYKVVSVIDHLIGDPAEQVLNQLGAEGWELAGIDTTFPAFPRYVFKRPIGGSPLTDALANPFANPLASPFQFPTEPELPPDQERILRNSSTAEALLVLPEETRNALLDAILSEEEKQCPTPPDDLYERVERYFAENRSKDD